MPRAEVYRVAVSWRAALCVESNGALVYAGDSRLVHNITRPGKLIGRGIDNFYSPTAREFGQHGLVFLSYVVEIDGRTSLPAILKSHLDSAPVRFYIIMPVEF
jgi:hypothetical protein